MRLRVLHVIASPFPANQGTAGTIRELINATHSKGHEIEIVTYHNGQDIPLPGVKINRIPAIGSPQKLFVGFTKLRPIYDLMLVFKTLQTALSFNPHVIHAHHHEGVFASFLTRLLTGTPVVYHCVASMEEELPLYVRPKGLTAFLGRLIDLCAPWLSTATIAVSNELVEIIKSRKFHNVSYLPMIVDEEAGKRDVVEDPGSVRERFGIPNGRLVLYTGVINEFQNIDNLIKAFSIVQEKIPTTRLVIATSLPNLEQVDIYEDMVKELDLQDSVFFIRDFAYQDLFPLLSIADVTVIPRENMAGFPLKLLNYMAAGKPVVAMKGSAKILNDGVNGMVADSWQEMGEKTLRLLEDAELAKRIGGNGREELHNFTPAKVADEIVDVYLSLLNGKADRP